MKQFALSIILIVILLTSCSSVDRDAEKAARLNRKSMEYARELKLEKAEKFYKESREIIARYKDTDKFEEFHIAYSKYMTETAEK
jgi:hypothetical protein